MIFGDFVRLVVLSLLFGGDGKGGGGASSVPSGAFPSAKPSDLPEWPNGWCPDLPPAPEVASRAWALLPTLWAKGENTRTLEMTGGRWIWYVATTVDGQKSVAAYRTIDCEPGASATTTAASSADALLGSAIAMNEALKLRGYKKSDMVHYQDFQRLAGLAADGFPGVVTMLKLESVLKLGGQTIAPVTIYPWKATGGYDGVNAPTPAEWEGTQIPATSPIAQTAATPAASPSPAAAAAAAAANAAAMPATSPVSISPAAARAVSPAPVIPTTYAPPAAPTVVTPTDVQHALNVLGYKGKDGKPLTEDGKIGPNSQYAVLAFQKEHPPLAQDSSPGPLTKAALSQALSRGMAA